MKISCFSSLFLVVCALIFPAHSPLFAEDADDYNRLLNDMLIVDYWNQRLNERLPVTYNHLLHGGYFNMPSARMGQEGEIGVGYSSVPPYRNYNLRCQIIDRLEISGNYRIFRGVDDPILSPLGFGDLSDKGANIKLSLFHPEDSNYRLPGLAIGYEDFMGTKNFNAKYVVLTQVFLDANLEISLGYGAGRIRRFFGGFSWMPFRKTCYPYLQGLSLVAEYDAIPYCDPLIEKHPKGRVKRSPINFGLKYRLWDQVDLSVSCVRGRALAFSASTFYNMGMTRGFLPKINDTLPYKAPIVTEPLGILRPEDLMVQDFFYALRKQGFDLLEVRLGYDLCLGKTLRIRIYNTTYRLECEVRCRLTELLAYLAPSDLDHTIVVIEDEGFPIQEYHFNMEYVRAYAQGDIGPHELHILSPLCEVRPPDPSFRMLFRQWRDTWNFELFPKTHTFFGSARGKFKYGLGLNAGLNGFLFDSVYYSLRVGYIFLSDLENLQGTDRLNPSQLPNVRTDIVRYYKHEGFSLDEAYLQKNWNIGRGWYSRVAMGYFEEEYAGVATEFLYYPLHTCFAIGVEGAIFKKRAYTGLGFTNEVRQLHGFVPSFHPFQFYQYFLDLYYEWHAAKLDFKIMAGKFLANDYGVRYEVSRYFPSGLRILFWYTHTNGHDKINGSTYFDKGVAFTMPMDIFYTHSDRSRWSYGLSAWLRDVGVTGLNGQGLYELIREQRNNN